MKLRIYENSLRFRLSRSEVEHFRKHGAVSDRAVFGNGRDLQYALIVADSPSLNATYENSAIQVEVPRALARDWTETDRVGISAEQPNKGERSLHILIEKDFKCIHQPGESEDAYPNPLETQPA